MFKNQRALQRRQSVAVLATAIETSCEVLNKLSGDSLNGNMMNNVERRLAIHMQAELKKRGVC